MREVIPVPGTSIALTRLGLGCARLFSGSEARMSRLLIDAALDCGIRHFDTAPSYSYGQSEDILGAALAGVDGVTITTKVGISHSNRQSNLFGSFYRRTVRPFLAKNPRLKRQLLKLRQERTNTQHESQTPLPKPLFESAVRRSLEGSLKRLQRERIDLLLVHEPDGFILDHETRLIFERLISEGLIKGYGLAYGRYCSTSASFGSVLQARYDPKRRTDYLGSSLRLYHGVLRTSLNQDSTSALSAPAAIADALRRQPLAGIIFSASHVDQIRDIAAVTKCHE